ncbi:hypothetical protein SAY87_018856 [Trapa incisa]|uniref:PB1 domain-containing protein n=1 Tax=Trapa incisa TaxID=236973 RepID=A0AAN7K5J5_9MYRT|nr:hypothetical protein SAY87_018856 [Trapa incisa]
MENFTYSTYPDSSNSSPRSREVDFDNQPWDEQQQQQPPPPNYKAKFMCSYGGKIHPRPHDNQLSYMGGETKIIAVDRNIKFSTMISRLAILCGDAGVSFKYQLPGEDLDALISVTNDDDLDHLMHEHDRLYRSSAKPARMRLFVFPAVEGGGSFGPGQLEAAAQDTFVEALNLAPSRELPKPVAAKADFLFGMEKGVSPPPPPPPTVVMPDPVDPPAAVARESQVGFGREERVFGSDHGVIPAEIQRQLQELQRLQISGLGKEMYTRKSEEATSMGGSFGGPADCYVEKMPEKVVGAANPSSVPTSTPAGYWPDMQIPGGASFSGAMTAPLEQPLYLISSHGGLYHAPPTTRTTLMGQPSHGYYAVPQRTMPDAYRDQPIFNMAPPQHQQQQHPRQHPMSAPPALQQQQQQQLQKMSAAVNAEGFMMGRQGSAAPDHIAYAPVGYDGATGRQIFYTAAGGAVAAPPLPQYQGMAAADMRTAGQVVGQDGKVIAKVSQG